MYNVQSIRFKPHNVIEKIREIFIDNYNHNPKKTKDRATQIKTHPVTQSQALTMYPPLSAAAGAVGPAVTEEQNNLYLAIKKPDNMDEVKLLLDQIILLNDQIMIFNDNLNRGGSSNIDEDVGRVQVFHESYSMYHIMA